jgi:hypothetical protein
MAFDRVKKILDNALALDENKIINQILSNKSFQEFIIDLNTEGQLFDKGINSLGVKLSDIGGLYSEITITRSRKKGKPKKSRSHVDLLDTEVYYKSFVIRLFNDSFDIVSDPNKDDGTSLFERWGKEIEGLTQESLQIVIDAIREKIIPIIRARILA